MSGDMKPILFSGCLVRAILAGRKTQTRRVIKHALGAFWDHAGYGVRVNDSGATEWYWKQDGKIASCGPRAMSPYGKPGDALWVRESTYRVEDHGHEGPSFVATETRWYDDLRKRPSIHMPKDYARLFLRIVRVRVERLQDITDADIRAEGTPYFEMNDAQEKRAVRLRMVQQYRGRPELVNDMDFAMRARFRELWNGINEKLGFGWEANPWVWVIEFEPDIERIEARGLCTPEEIEAMQKAASK